MYTLTYKDKSVKGLHVVGKKKQEDIPDQSHLLIALMKEKRRHVYGNISKGDNV